MRILFYYYYYFLFLSLTIKALDIVHELPPEIACPIYIDAIKLVA